MNCFTRLAATAKLTVFTAVAGSSARQAVDFSIAHETTWDRDNIGALLNRTQYV